MNFIDSILAIGGAYSGGVVAIILYLTAKRRNDIDKLRNEVMDRIATVGEESRQSHIALAGQVRAISSDMAREFVRKGDLETALLGLRGEVSATRSDIHEMRGMIFALVAGKRDEKL